MYLHNFLIFVGCLVSYVQCQTICKKNQYTVVYSDGSLSCLNCATCHDGRGLYPPCGSHILYPPKPDCIACPEGKFSDELDSAPCHSCQMCAEHEIVTAPCTSRSNRVCNGTCEAGFFYSKKDSTHSCQKCAYCCSDGKDEVISECVNQGSSASKKHCRPRPDKECSAGSSLPSPTDSLVGNEASESGSLSTAIIILIVFGVVSSVIIVTLVICLLYRTRKKQEERTVTVAKSYSQNGPTTEPPNTASNAKMSAAFHKERDSITVTVEGQNGVNRGADLHVPVGLDQKTASEQMKQNAALSSMPSGSKSVSDVHAPVKVDAGKDNIVSASDAAPPAGKVPVSDVAVASDLKDITSSGLRHKLSRQLSKDSQRSGSSFDNEAGGRKRSPSTSSFTEMVKGRRPSSKKDELLVANEEEDTDVSQVTVERQNGVNRGADLDLHVGLDQKTASEQVKQNAALSSVPSGSKSVSDVHAPVKVDAGKDNIVSASDAAPPAGKVPVSGDAVASDRKDTTGGSLMRKLSRQLSKDSQRSGSSFDNEAGGWKRSPSTSSFTEMVKGRRPSSKKDELLVANEEEDTDVSRGPIQIIQEPSSQKVKEGSKVELVFKCKVRGDGKLTYQWYKDGTVLPVKNEDTLVLKSVMLRDFGLYTCNCVASCKDGSSYSKDSLPVEVDVTPRDGMTYKCLKDLDLNTQDRIEDLLSQKRYSVGGCRHIASRYRMDQHKIKNLENDPEAGKKVLEYLGSSNPDLTVYDFCKTLKTPEIKRLDIVKELLEHLSVPSSSNVYV